MYEDLAVDRKEVKKKLKSSCRGVLEDLLKDVGFTHEEAQLFKERYFPQYEYSIPLTCLHLHISSSKYNDLHNIILDKIISYFSHIK
jgi:predicted transposase YdaD